jgi:hypothetical protein
MSDASNPVPKKKYLPQTGAVCPYKAAVIDEILERERSGGPIVSPRPEPRARDVEVDAMGFVYRGRPVRRPTKAELGDDE